MRVTSRLGACVSGARCGAVLVAVVAVSCGASTTTSSRCSIGVDPSYAALSPLGQADHVMQIATMRAVLVGVVISGPVSRRLADTTGALQGRHVRDSRFKIASIHGATASPWSVGVVMLRLVTQPLCDQDPPPRAHRGDHLVVFAQSSGPTGPAGPSSVTTVPITSAANLLPIEHGHVRWAGADLSLDVLLAHIDAHPAISN